ncbi:uncharacterized protein LOC126836880 [Adelges cooleyi]|uniref:uncharacterized protein LOC126836880 n=1 Tax=Adelges cooleyi TaxID=133065 RepID=UPI00218073B8|nr:uncharacterized protein LOC126836880 [Adelges cooleyi]
MVFKVSFSFLIFILVAKCTATDPSEASSSAGPKKETEAEIIEDLFNDCLKYYNQTNDVWEPTRHLVSIYYFDMYMSELKNEITYDDDEITIEYFNEHTDKKKIDFELLNLQRFSELFQYHCNKKNISVQEYAKDRKEAAIIRDSLKDCIQYIRVDLRHDVVNPILMGHCTLYMVKTIESYEVMLKYFNERDKKYFSKIRDERLNLKHYSKLFKRICNEKNMTVQECAKEWKEKRIFEDLFKDFSKRFSNVQSNRVLLDHFIEIMSKPGEIYQITEDYFIEHTDKKKKDFEKLNLQQFEELFTYHCKKRNMSIEECADDRKYASIIEDSFKVCLEWMSHYRYRPFENIITCNMFIECMGGLRKDQEISDKFFEDHPEEGQNKENIGLELYSKLFKDHCKKIGYPQDVCAEKKKSKKSRKYRRYVEQKDLRIEKYEKDDDYGY